MPLLYKEVSPLYGVWKMEETSEELLARLERQADYLPFLDQVSAEKRRREHLASRVLLKELLGVEAQVDYRATGAPFLPSLPLYISISHTKDHVTVILDKRPTGIDIEYRSNRVMKIRDHFMRPDEEADLDLRFEVECLLLHWCAKETLFKLIGQEGVDFQRHLHILPFTYFDSGTFMAQECRAESHRIYRLAYRVTPEYVLTWIAPS